MASMLGASALSGRAMQQCVAAQQRCSLQRPAAPTARVQRSRAVAVQATTKAPTQPVKITIQGRRLPVTDAIKAYVEDKITKAVHNYATNIKKIDVTLSARGGDTGTHGARQQKVDVTISTMRSGVVRVEDAEDSLYASIDLVCDKVSRKLQKLKERLISQRNWPGRAGPRVSSDDADFKEYMEGLIVEARSFNEEEARAAELQLPAAGAPVPAAVMRSKVVRLDPLSADEAIDALEAVGHDFYLYKDATSGTVQVLYKRESGGYGILIPQ